MTDMSHLHALELRLHNERGYLARAKTEGERALRRVWIAQIEKEILGEQKFLSRDQPEMTDEEILAELMSE